MVEAVLHQSWKKLMININNHDNGTYGEHNNNNRIQTMGSQNYEPRPAKDAIPQTDRRI